MNPDLHPTLSPAEKRRLVEEGIALFNAGRFYDCHEAWEIVWRSTTPQPRDLWRGLIQVAVGFYHHVHRHRPDVAHRVLGKGRHRLAPYVPDAQGLDVADLLDQVDAWRAWLTEPSGPPPPTPILSVLRRSTHA